MASSAMERQEEDPLEPSPSAIEVADLLDLDEDGDNAETAEDDGGFTFADAERHLGALLAERAGTPTSTSPSYPADAHELPVYDSDEERDRRPMDPDAKKGEEEEKGKDVRVAKGVVHWIGPSDTLVGLSLRYNVSVEAIRTANRLFTNSIFERGCLLIPVTNYSGPLQDVRSEEDERKSLVKRFQIVTKCIDNDECWSYMRRFDFQLERALEEYWSDVRWERDNPYTGSIPQHPLSHQIGSSALGKGKAKASDKGRKPWVKVLKKMIRV